jgi:gluconate 5-dehydrogenase
MNTLSLFDLQGKTALITGSESGIGFALAEGLSGAGAKIVINGLSNKKLSDAENYFKRQGAKVTILAFDVGNRNEVIKAIDKYIETEGNVDILINNAGINIRSSFIDFKEEDWKKIFDVNLSGAMIVTQAILPQMIKKNAGKIINMCSLYSALGRASVVPYSVSKGGLKMFTKALCAEMGKYNIQVNGIGPGFIETEMTQSLKKDASFNKWLSTRTPAGRWGNPKDLIGTVVFLASEASNFVNGQILHVDGGILASV